VVAVLGRRGREGCESRQVDESLRVCCVRRVREDGEAWLPCVCRVHAKCLGTYTQRQCVCLCVCGHGVGTGRAAVGKGGQKKHARTKVLDKQTKLGGEGRSEKEKKENKVRGGGL
jgi:hypothetical protein